MIEEVKAQNEELAEERRRYDETLHFADLHLCTSRHFKTENGAIFDKLPKELGDPKEAPMTKLLLNVDIRSSVYLPNWRGALSSRCLTRAYCGAQIEDRVRIRRFGS